MRRFSRLLWDFSIKAHNCLIQIQPKDARKKALKNNARQSFYLFVGRRFVLSEVYFYFNKSSNA